MTEQNRAVGSASLDELFKASKEQFDNIFTTQMNEIGLRKTILIGERIPAASLMTMTDEGPQAISTGDLFGGKRVVLFSVPGAFTPICSAQHLPGFVASAATIKAKGIDTIACLAVNDAFVMCAWAGDQHVGGQILMLADGNGNFTRALGLEVNLAAHGLGVRGRRFALIAEDGIVSDLEVESGTGLDVSSAENMLSKPCLSG